LHHETEPDTKIRRSHDDKLLPRATSQDTPPHLVAKHVITVQQVEYLQSFTAAKLKQVIWATFQN